MAMYKVDYKVLYEHLDDQRTEQQLSWRQLSEEVKVPPGTFTRLRVGKGISDDTFVTLVWWMGMHASIEPFLMGGPQPLPEPVDAEE